MATSVPSGLFSETYQQDLALRRGFVAHSGSAAVGVALVAFPFVASDRWQTIGVFAVVYAVAALGLQVLTGMAGQVSLGHAAFLGVGAYAATWLGLDHGLALYLWLPGAGLAAAAAGALIGPLAARLRGLYLSVITVALLFVAQYVWDLWVPVTGGSNGRSTVAATVFGHNLLDGANLAGVSLNGSQLFWFLALAVAVPGAYAVRNIQRTRIGRAFASIRERDVTAAVAGIEVTRTKVTAFVVSSFYAGVAGALLAAFQSYALPSQWNLLLSIQFIAMIVIGGLGSAGGAAVGAAFVTAIPELVRSLAGVIPLISTQNSPSGGLSVELVSAFLYGAIIVVVLVVEPRGLVGLWERWKLVWRTWPWSY